MKSSRSWTENVIKPKSSPISDEVAADGVTEEWIGEDDWGEEEEDEELFEDDWAFLYRQWGWHRQ